MNEHLEAEDLVDALRRAVGKVKRLDVAEVHDSVRPRDYGINSLRALRICAQVDKETGISLRPWDLLDGGSLAEIARETLGRPEEPAAAEVRPAPEGGSRFGAGTRPLSNAEERMWFLQQWQPDSCQYVFTMRLRLDGPVDPDVLRAAFEQLLARHDPLRTTYVADDDGGVRATIAQNRPFVMPVADLSDAEPSRIDELLTEERETPFALDREPLLRAQLWRLGPDRYLLVCSTHHIAFDGWSVPILLEELDREYRRIAGGGSTPAPPPDHGYQEFVAAQNAAARDRDSRLSWWRDYLADVQLGVTVPGNLPDSGRATGGGAAERFELPAELAQRVRNFAVQRNTSAYVVLLTAFGALVQRYSGAESLMVGTPLTNRTKAGFQSLIGMFVNTVVVAYRFDDAPGFDELVARTHRCVVEAFDRQDLPFSDLVQELRPAREADRSPLFRVMFDLHAFPLEQPEIGPAALSGPGGEPLSINATEVVGADAKFDLSLTVEERYSDFVCGIEYRRDHYTPGWVRRFATDYERLLDEFLERPQQPTSAPALPSTTAPGGSAAVLRGAQLAVPQGTVLEHFAENVAQRPDSVALVRGAERLTYAGLDASGDALARQLRAAGAGRGVRVAVLTTRHRSLVVAMLAVWRVGAAYVPLNSDHPASRTAGMLADSGAELVVVPPHVDPDPLGAHWRELDRTDEGFTVLGRGATAAPAAPPRAADLAYVLFTSGSTGRPKGVEVTHGALANAYVCWHDSYRLDRTCTYLQLASHTFDVFVGDVVRALCSGGKLVLAPDETVLDPPALHELMRREPVDFVEAVPAVLHGLMDHLEAVGGDLSFMRAVISGADVWTVRDHRRLRRLAGRSVEVFNSFGVTEATVDSSVYGGTAEAFSDEEPTPVGGPLPNTRMYVLDEQLRPVPHGARGELWLAGANLARGYAGRPDLTAQRFVADPFGPAGSRMYRTGDRAAVLDGGAVVLRGRTDRELKVRGVRVAPEEVEAALTAYPGVRRAVVTRPGTGEAGLSAYLCREPGTQVSLDGVRAHLRVLLPSAVCPTSYAVLDSLPLTTNGKVDQAALAEVPVRSAAAAGPTVPETAVQRDVGELLRQLLGVEEIGLRQHFFELGGHSLLLSRLGAQLHQQFGVRVPMRDLFEQATVAGIAELVSGAGAAAPAEPTLQRRSRRKATVLVNPGTEGPDEPRTEVDCGDR